MNKMLMTLVTVLALGTTAQAAETTTKPSTSQTIPGASAPSATMPGATAPMGKSGATAPMGSVFITTHPTMGERLSSKILGSGVYSMAGERIGDVNDLILHRDGKVSGVVVGVGGFLGMGEKNVALAWSSVTMGSDAEGKPRLMVPVTKDALKAAAPFTTTDES